MKKGNTDNKIINMDNEIKALAKAFIETALEKGDNASEINQIVRQVREENQIIPTTNQETQEEQEFRKKVKVFLKNKYVSYRQNYLLHYREDRCEKTTNVILELICGGYKLFNSEIEKIGKEELIRVTYMRLKSISNAQTSDERNIHKYFVEYGYSDLEKFCENMREIYWNKGLKEFVEQYECRKASAKEIILVMIWLVNKETK